MKTYDEQIEEIIRRYYGIRDDEEIVIDVNVYLKKNEPIKYIRFDCVISDTIDCERRNQL